MALNGHPFWRVAHTPWIYYSLFSLDPLSAKLKRQSQVHIDMLQISQYKYENKVTKLVNSSNNLHNHLNITYWFIAFMQLLYVAINRMETNTIIPSLDKKLRSFRSSVKFSSSPSYLLK